MLREDNEIDFIQNISPDVSTLLIGQECLKRGLRIDGRSLDSHRHVSIEFNGSPGSVTISFGNTVVFCCISQEIVDPNFERPNEGFLYFNVELSPFTSENYDPGKTSDSENNLIYFLENIFKESSFLDLETLCVTSGKEVWALRVYVHVLQDDGNLLGACSFAALAALAHYRKPNLQESEDFMYSSYMLWHKGVPLSIYNMPIMMTVSIIEGQDQYVLDANAFEEKILSTQISILYNQFGEVFWTYKYGSTPVGLETFEGAVSVSKKKAIKLYSLLKHELEKNNEMLKSLLMCIQSQ
ncbi:exosome complex exonuclease [Theileria orientalis]|uniref:Exosome complex exonuclease n=1 Tax=Theileria orientalis TaxID=68886 RepID=A0A976M3D8_THEOR|nr:exosome complex exonuclease [Theileria orientalis]